MNPLSLQDIRNDEEITQLINSANHVLEKIGYTDHGPRHVGYCSRTTADILRDLHFDERTVELGAMAGWLHDVGNAVNRVHHGITGAQMVYFLLVDRGMPYDEVCKIVSAIGNHEEETGRVVSELSAALVLADKSDAHRTRVRRGRYDPSDIHDRVNHAISRSELVTDYENKLITFRMDMDDSSSIFEFLQIYLSRMTMCEAAAEYLGCRFRLEINGATVIPEKKAD